MYPAATSFIPLTVALARFAQSHSVWGNYDFWYLGEVPFRYLTGPVVVRLILGLQALFGGFSLFEWSIGLVVVSWFITAFGWGILAWQLSMNRKVGLLVGLLTLMLPWHIVSSLALSEVSVVLASSFGPWVLISFISSVHQFKKRSAKHNLDSEPANSASLRPALANGRNVIRLGILARFVMFLKWITSLICESVLYFYISIFLFSILLLTNTVASIPTILGLGILSFVLYKHSAEGLKRAGLVVFLGGLLTLWWYDPAYWLKILFAPSFGGRSVIGAFLHVVDLARTLVPVVLAFIVVVWKVKPKNNFEKFAFLWLGSFVGLTLVRFAANIHFWLDWMSWFGEIEVGLALVFGMMMHSFVYKKRLTNLNALPDLDDSFRSGLRQPQISGENRNGLQGWLRHVFVTFKTASASFRVLLIFIILILSIGWGLVIANKSFWMPGENIENTVEFRIAKNLEGTVKSNDAVFLSGTTAFWLNAFYDIRQVRGGADYVGMRPDLARAVWEVRGGTSGEESLAILKNLGVRFLVVHAGASWEFYHDFENVGKFEGLKSFEKVYDNFGDKVYKIK